MLGRDVNESWQVGPPHGVWGTMLDHLETLDGLVLNLECCVSDGGERRPDRTFYFRADPDWTIPALRAGGVAWAGLANNHVLDYGPVALSDTTHHLADADIAHAGAAGSLHEAIRPSVVDVGGIDVAILAFTDRSPSYGAGPTDPGTAFVRFQRANRRTRGLVDRALRTATKADPDLVVASLHWGPNWEVRPSGRQRRFARWLVDRGVDVVHGHSAHVVQGIERYRGRPIIYDAGDFVDDYAIHEGLHNDRTFLFELAVADGRPDGLRLVPAEIDDESAQVADEEAAAWLRDRMRTLSRAFGTQFFRVGEGLYLPLSGSCDGTSP